MKIQKELYDLEKAEAIKLFNDVFPKKKIILIEKIHLGLTNISFKVTTTNDEIYQVRIGMNNEYVDRQNEYYVLKNINDKNYLYFDIKTGKAIKKWIVGQMPSNEEINLEFLLALNKQIEQYHEIEIKYEIKQHNYFEFEETFKYIKEEYINEYKKIIDSHKYDKLILSHNDLNPKNLIIDNQNKIHFIDFEWGRINHGWYDICNFIRETNVDIQVIKDFTKHLNINFIAFVKDIFACLCFALQWTYTVEQLKEIIDYRKDVVQKMKYYYNFYKNYKLM